MYVTVVLVGCVLVFVGCYFVGGKGLVRLYSNYLSQDLPEKRYTWVDFTDRGPGKEIMGYYAGHFGESVWIWTLSGLRYYQHVSGTSVYSYLDVCGAVRQLVESRNRVGQTDDSVKKSLDPMIAFDLNTWLTSVRSGDFVTLRWIEQGGLRVIDKLYGTSNQYYPIEALEVEQCSG